MLISSGSKGSFKQRRALSLFMEKWIEMWYTISMKVPRWFQKLYWWGNSSKIDVELNQRVVIAQTINRGNWDQWKWLVQIYGRDRLREIISNIPASEFRPGALKLILLLLGISKMNYASRNDYIKTARNL